MVRVSMKTIMAAILLVSPVLAGDVSQAAGSANACGPDAVKFRVNALKPRPAAQPEPGKALVYVVERFDRPANEWGKPTIRVGLDGAWVGANRDTSYLYFNVDPGEHHLCTDWQSFPPLMRKVLPALTALRAEAGETYYFSAHVIEHRGYFTLDLARENPDEGKMLVETVPLSDYRLKK